MNGKQLINKSQPPDPERWLGEHGDYLFRYALLRLQDSELAEDIVQETFLAALRSRDNFAGQASERTWLVGILKHKILDHFRQSYRECPVIDLEFSADLGNEFFSEDGHMKAIASDWVASPFTALEQREFREILERCLSELPPRLSAAFSLREMDELRSEEVCKILNISISNLHVMLYRARTHLRHCLEMNWFGSKARTH